MTNDEYNAKQRKYRKRTGNATTKRYEKNKKGFIMRLYRNMQSRVRGIQKIKYHLYEGIYLLPKEEFYEWAVNSPEFHRLFDAWESSGYQRRLTPSVDRIDSSRGYTTDNMEWVTFSENCSRGARNRRKKRAT